MVVLFLLLRLLRLLDLFAHEDGIRDVGMVVVATVGLGRSRVGGGLSIRHVREDFSECAFGNA